MLSLISSPGGRGIAAIFLRATWRVKGGDRIGITAVNLDNWK
jgi:hypothetical protein